MEIQRKRVHSIEVEALAAPHAPWHDILLIDGDIGPE
jgi:hypothetical protein